MNNDTETHTNPLSLVNNSELSKNLNKMNRLPLHCVFGIREMHFVEDVKTKKFVVLASEHARPPSYSNF